MTPLPKEVKDTETSANELKDKRIKAEEKRLKEIYKDLGDAFLKTIIGLIERAAFMRISLEDYEADLNDKGYVEQFSQSKDLTPYERERPVARLYNTMNKNYQSIMKQLTDLLPKQTPNIDADELLDFINSRDE